MKAKEITPILTKLFDAEAVRASPPDSWQVEKDWLRLLIILSEDQTWLRVLIAIASAQEAEPYLAQLLEANFDRTQETRYALNQGVLWGVFQHSRASLTPEDFESAVLRLVSLGEAGLSKAFDRLADQQIRQIIAAAKLQGQSREATLQNLTRFYEEGMLGGIDQDPEEREQFLKAWEYQLERLWSEVDPDNL